MLIVRLPTGNLRVPVQISHCDGGVSYALREITPDHGDYERLDRAAITDDDFRAGHLDAALTDLG